MTICYECDIFNAVDFSDPSCPRCLNCDKAYA